MKNSIKITDGSGFLRSVLAVFLMVALTEWAVAEDFCTAAPLEGRGRGNVLVCDVDFPGLWYRRDSFDGKYVKITGFATYVDGVPYVFASKDLYRYMAARGGIVLELDSSDEVLFEKLVSAGGPITLQGKYMRNSGRAGAIGVLVVPKRRFWPETMPGDIPERPPG